MHTIEKTRAQVRHYHNTLIRKMSTVKLRDVVLKLGSRKPWEPVKHGYWICNFLFLLQCWKPQFTII